MLLDLLSCEEAASLGTEVYAAHAQRMKMKRFLLKLAIAYKHLPTYHVKVRRCLGYDGILQCCGSMKFWYGSGAADPYL